MYERNGWSGESWRYNFHGWIVNKTLENHWKMLIGKTCSSNYENLKEDSNKLKMYLWTSSFFEKFTKKLTLLQVHSKNFFIWKTFFKKYLWVSLSEDQENIRYDSYWKIKKSWLNHCLKTIWLSSKVIKKFSLKFT